MTQHPTAPLTGEMDLSNSDRLVLALVFAKWNADRNSEPRDLFTAMLAAGFRRTPEGVGERERRPGRGGTRGRSGLATDV